MATEKISISINSDLLRIAKELAPTDKLSHIIQNALITWIEAHNYTLEYVPEHYKIQKKK